MTLVPAKNGLGYIRSDDPGEPVIGKPRVSITEAEGLILSGLALGKNVLEIGTGLGVSTRALAKYASSVITHDIDEWVHLTVWPELADTTTNVKFAIERPEIRVDVVFIDGDHDTAAVRADIAYAKTCLGKHGLIIAHDTNYENVQFALDNRWQRIPTEHGLGLRVMDAQMEFIVQSGLTRRLVEADTPEEARNQFMKARLMWSHVEHAQETLDVWPATAPEIAEFQNHRSARQTFDGQEQLDLDDIRGGYGDEEHAQMFTGFWCMFFGHKWQSYRPVNAKYGSSGQTCMRCRKTEYHA